MPNIKQTFNLPTPFEQQVAEANRRQKLAELMQQEASTPVESQMVSGRVVPTSPLLALTKMLQGYMGGKFASQADEQRAAAEKSDMASAMDWMKNMPTSQQGYTEGAAAGLTPNQASAINLPSTVPGRPSPAAGMTPEQAAITNTPDQPSAPREANIGTMPVSAAERENYLLGGAIGQSPRARMLAQALLAKKPETPEYYDAVPVTVNGVTKMVQYSKTGGAPRAVEGQKYEKPDKLEATPSAIQEYKFAKDQGYPGTFEQWTLELKKAGGSIVNVNTATETAYSADFARGRAQRDLGVIQSGEDAVPRIQTSHRINSLLDANPITGTGAELRLNLHKALATAGLADPSRVSDTENLASSLAGATLDSIKSSGLGSGQGFTDKDREFLEKARSGNIGINPQTLRDISDLNERAARAAIVKSNETKKRVRLQPQFKDMGLEDIAMPQEYGVALPKGYVVQPKGKQ